MQKKIIHFEDDSGIVKLIKEKLDKELGITYESKSSPKIEKDLFKCDDAIYVIGDVEIPESFRKSFEGKKKQVVFYCDNIKNEGVARAFELSFFNKNAYSPFEIAIYLTHRTE